MTDDLRRQARFLDEVELAIRAANREIISHQIPTLDRDSFVRLAVSVGRLRAAYLQGVMTMDWTAPGDTALSDLQHKRALYEEARAGFEALRHCMVQGYVDIGDGHGPAGGAPAP